MNLIFEKIKMFLIFDLYEKFYKNLNDNLEIKLIKQQKFNRIHSYFLSIKQIDPQNEKKHHVTFYKLDKKNKYQLVSKFFLDFNQNSKIESKNE